MNRKMRNSEKLTRADFIVDQVAFLLSQNWYNDKHRQKIGKWLIEYAFPNEDSAS
jgi:hypothetical protein